jgi:hypothetical protein
MLGRFFANFCHEIAAATLRSKGVKIDWLEIGENVPECSDMATCRLLFIFSELELLKSNKACWYSTKRRHFIEGNLFSDFEHDDRDLICWHGDGDFIFKIC